MSYKSFNARNGISVGATPAELIDANGVITLVTGTAAIAPLKFAAGTQLTTPVVGAVEFDGTNLSITITGAVRKALAFTDSNITGTASNITGTLAVAQGGTGATAVTGTGNNVLSTSPTITTPVINSILATAAGAAALGWSNVTTGTVGIATGLTAGGVVTIGTAAGATALPGAVSLSGIASGNLLYTGANGLIGTATAANVVTLIGSTAVTNSTNTSHVIGGATGSIVYQSAANTTGFLAAVAAGQVLASNGTGAAPVWTGAPVFSTSVTVPLVQGTAGTGGAITIRGGTDTTGTINLNAAVINTSVTNVTLFGTPTSVTAFGAATALSLGASTGTTTVNNSLVVTGDLTVNGTVTTVNSTTVSVDDKNIELGSVASPSNATADGGGITLKGTTDKTIAWDNANSNWTSSEHWNLLTGKVFKINNVQVLSATALGSTVVSSSLTSVGTLTALSVSGQITSSVTTGTAPFVVSSTTLVANLAAQTAVTATNVAGGAAGDFVYQTGSGATGFRGAAQATAALDLFTSTLKGLVPGSGGGTANFLRADGTWAAPPGSSGTVTSVSVVTANGVSGSVATNTTTPAITIVLGDITPSSVVSTGALSGTALTVGSGTTTSDVITAGAMYRERAGALTTAATSQATLDSWAVATFRSAKYIVQILNTTTGNVQITELLVTRDNSNNVYITEYGSVASSSALATFDADYDGSANVRLRIVPASANSTQFKFNGTLFNN